MTVVHIAYKYGTLAQGGGATIAATLLHKALLEQGVDSHYVCVHVLEEGPNVHRLPRGVLRGLFLALTKVTRCMWKFTPKRRTIPLNAIPLFGLKRLLRKLNPDIVHLQWLNIDVCSFGQLASLPYKMVFNLHDFFMLQPEYWYPYEDRRFITGLTRRNSTWLERWMMGRKQRLVARRASAFVGPSEWICGMCRQSVVGRNRPAYAISNVIDPVFLAEGSGSDMRRANARFAILFGGYGGRGNRQKGFADLVRSLALLPDETKASCELRILGEAADPCVTEGVQTTFLGIQTRSGAVRDVYRSVDVLAFPSLLETQGLMKAEALCCGVPVVVFDRSACAEGISQGENGWIAGDGNVASYAEGLQFFFSRWKAHAIDHVSIASHARTSFNSSRICSQCRELYEKMKATS